MKPSPASSPSTGLMQFAEILAGKLILDAPCGYGRNTIALAKYECNLVGADRDRHRLTATAAAAKQTGIDSARLKLIHCDLSESGWCFGSESFDAIVCVHFDFRPILMQLLGAVRPGGYLYIESFGGQGRNYLDLPPPGFLREVVSGTFTIKSYHERKVGPPGTHAVAVRTFCCRQS